MKKLVAIIVCFLLAAFLGNIANASKFINIKAKGSLESKYSVGCVSLDELNNKYTPADIYPGFVKCIEENNMKYGVRLFFLAGTYGRFDILRVTDRSAHQAVRALQILSYRGIREKKIKTFMKKLKDKVTKNNNKLKDEICIELKEFGRPKYYPTYMIQHGLEAFTPRKNSPLKKDFDPKRGWKASLKGYMHCPNI